MVALFSPPSQLSPLEWLLEDPISHELENMNHFFGEGKTQNLRFSPNSSANMVQQIAKNGEFASFSDGLVDGGDEGKMLKKLDHNASERDRRKKINALYSTLRSLLPPEDNLRKLSIPNTVSRMINYIPELQQEVERLGKKKETLIISSSNISKVDEPIIGPKSKKIKLNQSSSSSSSMVSVIPINDHEIMFHISMSKTEKCPISEVLMRLENEGFIAINVASFESFDGRVFYNLHLQAQGNQVPMDAEILKKKVWP